MNLPKDILATLAYYDLFNYPLTQIEVFQFLQNHYQYEEFQGCLQLLVKDECIYKMDEFYSLQGDYSLVVRRRKGNIMAKKLLQVSEKVARILCYFPYVRGVAVSGSLSKNFADEKSDVDLFIITAGNRLWIARTIMHLFKKLTFLVNKQHYFCMNYYVDESALNIEEKNLFTATEIVTLLPLIGIETFRKFNAENIWTKSFLPNHSMKVSYVQEKTQPLISKIIEFLFNNKAGNYLDRYLMKVTTRRWNKKTEMGKLNNRGILMGLKTDRHYSKPDPENFQSKLVLQYEHKVFNLLERHPNILKLTFQGNEIINKR